MLKIKAASPFGIGLCLWLIPNSEFNGGVYDSIKIRRGMPGNIDSRWAELSEEQRAGIRQLLAAFGYEYRPD